MAVLLAFVAYLLGALLLSALLLPLTYPWLAALLGDAAEPSRALYRLAMLFMLLGLPWFLRRQDLLSWRAIGFTLRRRPAWSAVLQGFLIGAAMLLVLTAYLVLLGARRPAVPADFGAVDLLQLILAAAVAGLLVGVIEEAFFRGMMHRGMRRRLSFWPTALLTAGFYAAVHFIRPAELPPGTELDLMAALGMLWRGLAGLGELARIHDSFLALLLAGVFLSMVRERTGSICWVIGIHAGWVLAIKVAKRLTDAETVGGGSAWIGQYDQFIGWAAVVWLALLTMAYWRGIAIRPGMYGRSALPAPGPTAGDPPRPRRGLLVSRRATPRSERRDRR